MKKGNVLILATSRSYLSIMEEIRKYHIEYDYLILCHGAVTLKGNEVISKYTIPNKIKEKIIKLLKLREKRNYIISSTKENVNIDDPDIVRIHIYFDTLEEATKAQKLIQEKYRSFVHCYLIESNKAIEIISSKTSKSTAIKEIEILEESKAIYTIGDSYNDICMIEDYRGSIMKNAVSELKDKNYKEYESVSEFIEDVLKNEE